MKIVIANSNIASNVGNGFFYLGIEYVLKRILGDVTIVGGYFSPFNAYQLKGGARTNNYDDLSYIGSDVDALVIAGPVLDRDFGFQFENTLKACKNRGVKVYLLSMGGRAYSPEEIDHCRSVLVKYPPDLFVSRDDDTFSNYADLCSNSYNGLCFAFFVADAFEGYSTADTRMFVSSCIDFAPEPDLLPFIHALEGTPSPAVSSHSTRSFRNKVLYMLQRNLPDSIGGYEVVRLCHRPLRPANQIFFKSNMVSSFTIDPYLNIYKNTCLTVTDRLHAAVATLSFGKPACLLLNSNRTRLLDRAKVSECINQVFSMPEGHLNAEKGSQLSFMSKFFS